MAYSRDAFIETREHREIIERERKEGLLIDYRKTGKIQDMELWLMAYHQELCIRIQRWQ